ncbi:ABC transporter substrate-binding protein [Cellulomonas dongxiuzhuiae]|uniref:ABC transporter substrate-binding protein n=1 Tax=Cellulomonas dongxiuzhuiae TaxID=2819979 RepID=UPI001AAE71A3|nr:sugar ABC transporter substrate-binding protein [Cellulomonas dongxiuzhuiae]MBO3088263.1 extracellular solute-binding protein [Cellulomonas dongxiuzhuiae]
MMNKRMSALALASVLGLAACSTGSTGGPTSTPGASVDPDEKITLRVMSTTMAADPEMSAEQAIADAFMAKHPNVTIEFTPVAYPDYGTRIATVATSGDVPDVFTNGPELAARIADLGIAQDLTPLLGEDFVTGFDQDVLAESYVGDELAYAPYYTIPMSLIYRTDLLEEAGVEPPTTWDEFVDVAKALTVDKNGDGTTDQWGFAMVGAANASGGSRFVPVLRSFGAAELREEDGSYVTDMDSEGAAKALQLYSDLVNVHGVVPPGALNTAYPDAVNLMASGQTAMIISGSHAIGSIAASGGAELEDTLGSVPVPRPEDGEHVSVLGQLGFSVSATTEHPEVAAEYIKFYLAKENQLAWTDATGRLPVRLDALEDPALDTPRYHGFIDAMAYGYLTPQAPYYLNVQQIAAEAYQAAINGTAPEKAASDAATRIEEEIANNG